MTDQRLFSSGLPRRDFLKIGGATAAASVAAGGLPVVAGPFPAELGHLIPADKKLAAGWVKALYERGEPEVATGDQLRHIGMPVGGIACGQLYLGGDGRLWHWDILRPRYSSAYGSMSMGIHYANPPSPSDQQEQPLRHGFALRVGQGDKQTIRPLSSEGFGQVRFRGEYPIGRVQYREPLLPLEVDLEAFSPFLPLNATDSALPCTLLNYTLRNTGTEPLQLDVAGWLENAVCPEENAAGRGRRRITFQADGFICSATEPDAEQVKNPRPPILFADFEDVVPGAPEEMEDLLGFGTLCLRLRGAETLRSAAVGPASDAMAVFSALDGQTGASDSVETDFDTRPIGAVAGTVALAAGQSRTVTFVLAWHFPHYPRVTGEMSKVQDLEQLKRHYARRFVDAGAVADYVDSQIQRLTVTTRLWNRTWYDSTLPYWLLDRCFISINCLASTALHWFDNGRVWAWEGTDCCPGTCQHVWNYAQGMARIFPELERTLREVTDYGIAFRENGALDYRAECSRRVAHDGQCGTIMRVWREHATSPNDAFLRRLWPRVKQSIAFLIAEDGNGDGILEGAQYNTLDQAWMGPMSWVSSLYLGALSAGAAMADVMGETEFSAFCRQIIAQGRQRLVNDLFDGEYFVHKPNDNYQATNTNLGCHIDQVLGQSWAIQLGLPRVVAKTQTESALRSLWKYNFAPDAGGYRNRMQDVIKGGRWYAMPGEAGLLMTTWPKGGAEKAHGSGKAFEIGVGYFNECMNGFEYQAAAHMIYEGAAGSELVEHGLAITRAVHDRYAAARRNPYNEVECSDHYSRSMAAYGVFLGLCGFEYNGPEGHIGFAPRVTPASFPRPITAAQGWGTFEQTISDGVLSAKLTVVFGQLRLSTFAVQHPGPGPVSAQVNGQVAEASRDDTGRTIVELPTSAELQAGQAIELVIRSG